MRPERVSRNAPHPLRWRFSRVCVDRVPVRSFPACVGRVRHRSKAVDVDHRHIVGRRLNSVAFVMGLDELGPVGRRATGRRDGRWVERFPEMCQDLPDRPRIGDERDESDVAAAVRARKRKLLPHPGQEFRPGNP